MRNKGVKVLALTVCLSTFALFAMGSGSTGESTVDKEIVRQIEKKAINKLGRVLERKNQKLY